MTEISDTTCQVAYIDLVAKVLKHLEERREFECPEFSPDDKLIVEYIIKDVAGRSIHVDQSQDSCVETFVEILNRLFLGEVVEWDNLSYMATRNVKRLNRDTVKSLSDSQKIFKKRKNR